MCRINRFCEAQHLKSSKKKKLIFFTSTRKQRQKKKCFHHSSHASILSFLSVETAAPVESCWIDLLVSLADVLFKIHYTCVVETGKLNKDGRKA